MLFHTTEFALFLIVTLALFHWIPNGDYRRYLLLAASYFFYASWNPKFLLLLWALTIADYAAALWIERSNGTARKAALIAGVSANLAFLGIFKYSNFLFSNIAALAGAGRPFVLDVVLPLGISFHTFQSISYIVDVYRGRQAAIRSLPDYALFIAFFPQLVAGPIVRARDFFHDLFDWKAPAQSDVAEGLLRLLLGLLKKMAFADQFALVADPYFANPASNPGYAAAWSAALAFALQIYCDFSGYSDMAIGMARLFGFRFPENFAQPYLAASVTEFWRRWHISLSTWLRDYLYIPLGGNRFGAWMTYRNLAITMLLGGLWHGARWNFVVWGAYQGALLAVERGAGAAEVSGRWRLARMPLTFALLLIGWVLFRAGSLAEAAEILGRMFTGPAGQSVFHAWHWGLAFLVVMIDVTRERWNWTGVLAAAPGWSYAAAAAAMLFGLELFAVTATEIQFIYFQF
jgi:alginate O-acetyltransferase complex protein AlgI